MFISVTSGVHDEWHMWPTIEHVIHTRDFTLHKGVI